MASGTNFPNVDKLENLNGEKRGLPVTSRLITTIGTLTPRLSEFELRYIQNHVLTHSSAIGVQTYVVYAVRLSPVLSLG